ncbi:Protein of unknown function [Escherichia coli]|nr:Protein of unknown function [Escherichia coli]CDU39633.1 Protein of unknown function [Escherichia coli]
MNPTELDEIAGKLG